MERYDLDIPEGCTWATIFHHDDNGAPVDLTGYTAAMAVAPFAGAEPRMTFTTESGHIVLGADGSIRILLSPDDSRSLMERYLLDPPTDLGPRMVLVYDIKLSAPDDTVICPVGGRAIIHREVTEWP